MNFKPDDSKGQDHFFEVDGVRVYGERIGSVTAEELEQLEVSTENVMHIVRHFTGLSDESRGKLVGQELQNGEELQIINETFINAQLESTGSKFNGKLDDPELIVQLCRNLMVQSVQSGRDIAWVKEPGGDFSAKLQVEIPAEMKKQIGINEFEKLGTSSVIPITPGIAGQVKKEQRGRGEIKDLVQINVIEGIPSPKTDTLIIEIKKRDENATPYLYTAYTGTLAPSLPRPEKQSAEELAYNQEWWDRHAFIK
ncbi:MAG: hypothetical protein WC693_06940 [Patescibacteria group bacterium]|jgi:hypothetical protein